jgi:hypothetical protein
MFTKNNFTKQACGRILAVFAMATWVRTFISSVFHPWQAEIRKTDGRKKILQLYASVVACLL